MEFDDWEPVYEAVLADFGYDRRGDERARDTLDGFWRDDGGLAEPLDLDRPDCPDRLDAAGREVAVVGAAPGLARETHRAAEADLVFAASTAADVLRDAGVAVDCMVTDLDKNPEMAVALTREGVPVVVHAHGDNRAAVRRWVPEMDGAWVVPTTQAEPAGVVRNYGGFTDGDRAAFLADHLGAGSLRFVGWEFDDPSLTSEKRRKLAWAERLLYWLEQRRGERFGVLDGRRDAIDASGPLRE
jgi:uncharacterized Rossmann fold enzyme